LLTHGKTVVISGLKENYGMATDKAELKIYFRNGSSISRANLDGTGVEVFLQDVEGQNMGFDWLRRRIFWVPGSSLDSRIYVTYLESQGKTELTKTGFWNFDIAVDPTVG
jgi:hypothetical protein